MANPGQALSYKIGQLKIRELRAKAEKDLGKNFDIKEFHNQILETGCVPLALLETKINEWIKKKIIKKGSICSPFGLKKLTQLNLKPILYTHVFLVITISVFYYNPIFSFISVFKIDGLFNN